MDAMLTSVAFLVLIAMGVYLIHRLNAQHAERIALRTYRRFLPGRRNPGEGADAGTLPDQPPPTVPADRHDHRDGGRGRFRARRRHDRTTHKQSH
ncbi:hypothetical protein OG785_01830 [Streptomyces sp. NBC_00006]|uniref:hypothetical protein n=2 Tax=unclassified Streptomyces TaxID=2593676 RepID=UPI002252B89A|nr:MULTISPECIES: hypothetical protein [unclassified Streptomyces]MCX4834807.1 hypothetical protein [Streptomyces sp. NBC_01016]MCX5529314.1 hypothetical protein [Streptomyces sp. NBC_00006]